MQKHKMKNDKAQNDKMQQAKIQQDKIQNYKVQRLVCEHIIEACITKMEHDIHVLLTGGSLPHTGAVSIFEEGIEAGSILLKGHKDGVVGSRWGKELSEKFRCRVTVVCGIHYDGASGSMIEEILGKTEDMLQEAAKVIKDNCSG